MPETIDTLSEVLEQKNREVPIGSSDWHIVGESDSGDISRNVYYEKETLYGRGVTLHKSELGYYGKVLERNIDFVQDYQNKLETLKGKPIDECNKMYRELSSKYFHSFGHYERYGTNAVDKFYINELLVPYLNFLESKAYKETNKEPFIKYLSSKLSSVRSEEDWYDSSINDEYAKSLARIGKSSSINSFKNKIVDIKKEHRNEHIGALEEIVQMIEEEPDRAIDHVWGISSTKDLDAWLKHYKNELKHAEKADFPYTEIAHDDCLDYGDNPDRFWINSYLKTMAQELESPDDQEKLCSLMTDLMNYEYDGMLFPYSETFSSLSSEISVPHLLKNLRNESQKIRTMSAEILYRMELGKIGVTGEGAKYLGKLYDLGKFNDPEFFVRRLNNSGLMAVLDNEKGGIKGVFPLDINAQEDIIKTEVRQLISQELFLPKADETPKQREEREEYLRLFMDNYENIFNDDFFEGTNVRLNSLELYEQGWFLMYYLELSEKNDNEGLEKLKDFVSKYGEYGLKAFLALDYCEEPGVIMEFADCSGISDEHKLDIFKTYNQIERISYEYRSLFEKLLSEDAKDFGTQLHEAFIRNSSEFLLAATLIAEGTEKEVSIQELLRGMNDIAKTMIGFKKILENSDSTELWRIPQYATEYDKDGNKLERATASFIFIDKSLNTRTSVFMRPQPTVRVGNSYGGEARININTAHLDPNGRVLRQSRVAVDLSDYGEYIGDSKKEPVVALDFCLDPIDPENTDQGDELTRLLKSVPTYQGHHNEKSFSQNLPQHFPEIVESFWSFMESSYKRTG